LAAVVATTDNQHLFHLFVELGPAVERNGVVFIPMRSASEEHGGLVD
jgi:hypothetical protein